MTQGVNPQEQVDAILKAFHRLPPSELERLKVTIDQPIQANTPEAEVLINAWKVRQAELKEAMKSVLQPAEHMANLTRVLNGTSESIQPLQSDEQVYLLRQLESLLDDVDNARDFYTIGAWPTLLSFLTAQHTDEARAAAAWAVGTAVKNTYDYQLWTLETIPVAEGAGQHSGLELLVALLEPVRTSADAAPDSEGITAKANDVLKRALYALSAAMRGNLDVQEALRSDNQAVPFLAHLLRLASTPNLAADLQRKIWAGAADLLEERAFIRRELSEEVQRQLQAQQADNSSNTSTTAAADSATVAPVEVAARSLQSMPLLGDLLLTETWLQTAARSGRELANSLLEKDSRSADIVSQHAALRSVMSFLKAALQDSPELYNLPAEALLQDSWQGQLQQLVRTVTEDLARTAAGGGSYEALVALSEEVGALIGLLDQGANAAVF